MVGQSELYEDGGNRNIDSFGKSTAEERQQLASLFPKKTIGTSATNAYIQFLEANLHKSWSPFAAMSAMVPCMKLYAYIGQQKSKELSTWNVDSTAHP